MSAVEPYYVDDAATIYHGDCRELTPLLAKELVDVALVLTDPPYGVNERTTRASRGSRPGRTTSSLQGIKRAMAPANDFPPVYGDDEPFDPSWLLAEFPRLILFGAIHYADRLPPSPSWIVWDKLDGLSTDRREIGLNDNADAELAWSNLGGPARIIAHRWVGLVRASERQQKAVHPTQKPVALMERLLQWRTQPGDLVFDPYMGSGPVAKAAKNLGRRYIGIEYEQRYCDVAVGRLAQEVLPW